MWFFSDSGMVWYVWDMWYAIMRCILKGFYHASNGPAENWWWSITHSFTLYFLQLFLYTDVIDIKVATDGLGFLFLYFNFF